MRAALIGTPYDEKQPFAAGSLLAACEELALAGWELELWCLEETSGPAFDWDAGRNPIPAVSVRLSEHALLFPQALACPLAGLVKERAMDLLVFANTGIGKELAVWLACELNCGCVTDAERLRLTAGEGTEEHLTVSKRMYSANLTAEVQILSYPAVLTLKAGAKEPQQPGPQAMETCILDWRKDHVKRSETIVASKAEVLPDTNALTNTGRLIAGGKGIGSAEGFALLDELAAQVDGMVGASRPAALNVWCGMEQMIGLSGVSVSPEVSLLLGISGSAAFLSGVGSGRLIAVNKDAYAPIFKHVDYGAVDDWKELVTALLELGREGSGE